MFAWPAACVTSVTRLAPLLREVFALEVALNVGLKFSPLQFPTWNGDSAMLSAVARPA